MKLPILSALCILSSFAICVAPPLGAAEEKNAPRPAASPAPTEEARNPWIFNVDFPGGSLEQLVKSVGASSGGVFNLVGDKADLNIAIPAISLRNTEPESLASALNFLVGPRGLNITRAQGQSFGGSRGQVNFPVYVIVKRNAIDRPAFDSFQLAPYLEKQSIDDIVTAIRTLWELNPANRPDALQLKFHPATKLLLASGTPEAIAVAGKVISTLAGSVPRPAGERVLDEAPEAAKLERERGQRRGTPEQPAPVKKE